MSSSKGASSSNRAKGKEKVQSYKTVLNKPVEEIQKEVLKTTPDYKKLSDEAYELADKTDQKREFIYPFIPTTVIWVTPIEQKYARLSAEEVSEFYLKEFADPFHFPKDYNFYSRILSATESVEFDSVYRAGSGNEIAYSKAFIKRVISPERWKGGLYQPKGIPKFHKGTEKIYINYFDYIKAWEGALWYNNRQRRHTWFLQFRDFNSANLPQWFVLWFFKWGLHPIIMPQGVRNLFDQDFKRVNSTLKNAFLIFTAYYQIPWIVKWRPIIANEQLEKFGEKTSIPNLGRQILIKWWDKFEFFSPQGIYEREGLLRIIDNNPISAPKKEKNVSELLKDLLAGPSKDELKRQLKEILAEADKEQKSTENTNTSSSDTMMQDAQDPYEEEPTCLLIIEDCRP